MTRREWHCTLKPKLSKLEVMTSICSKKQENWPRPDRPSTNKIFAAIIAGRCAQGFSARETWYFG